MSRAAFPLGKAYMQMRDVLGVVYDDAVFAPLFAARGRPAENPWRLALVTVIQFASAPGGCTPCPVRARCTHAEDLPRSLMLQEWAEHEAIQAARQRQQTDEFAAEYARRAGVEGTISQGIRALNLHRAR
jgi:nucleotide-binding universal stress UspA family protein